VICSRHGSPAFGTPPTIGPDGRVPGFEGAGLVSEIGPRVDQNLGLRPGLRVAFFLHLARGVTKWSFRQGP